MVARRLVSRTVLAVLALSAVGVASSASAYTSNRLFFQYERAKADRAAGVRSPSPNTTATQFPSSPYKVTRSGVPVKVRWYYALEQTCASEGRTVVNLVNQPQGGEVYTRGAMEYPNFPTTNTRSACNHHRVTSTDVFYRPRPGFTGSDRFTVEVVFPRGTARQDTYVVSVR